MPRRRVWVRATSAAVIATFSVQAAAFAAPPSPDGPIDAAVGALLKPDFGLGRPGCQPVSIPVIGTFGTMSGHYSAEQDPSQPDVIHERLGLTANSPIEGPIHCTWVRTEITDVDQGWARSNGIGIPLPCAVTDLFQSDSEVVSRAMIETYNREVSRFPRCDPEEPPNDNDANNNGLDDEWERQQEEGEEGGGGGGGGGGEEGGAGGALKPGESAYRPSAALTAALVEAVAEELEIAPAEAEQIVEEAYARYLPGASPAPKGKPGSPAPSTPANVVACLTCVGAFIGTVGLADQTLQAVDAFEQAQAQGNNAQRQAAWAAARASFTQTLGAGIVTLASCLACPPARRLAHRMATKIYQLTRLSLRAAVCAGFVALGVAPPPGLCF